MSDIPFTLGSITFRDLEVPSRLHGLGSYEAMAVHEFPGGTRTIQQLGQFPNKIVSWSGYITAVQEFSSVVQSTGSRLAQMAAVFHSKNEIVLNWGDVYLKGVVASFDVNPHHEHFIPYSVRFVPSKVQTISNGTPNVSLSFLLFNSINQVNTLITSFTDPSSLLPLPYAITNPMQLLLQDLNSFAGVKNPTPNLFQGLQTSINNAQTAIDPYVGSSDPIEQNIGLSFAAVLANLQNSILGMLPTQTYLRVANPNLFTLASQYLGDASQWQVIAEANGLTDPQPSGLFNLVIPVVGTTLPGLVG